jgi:alkylation response protein AidB-like acyl-CoA dehydrogenase
MDTEMVGALRESAQRIVGDHCSSQLLHRLIDQGVYDEALWQQIGELGWLAVMLPEEMGGLGGGIAEVAALQQELGRATAAIPFHSTTMAARAVALWPHDEVRALWLDRVAAGQLIGSIPALEARGGEIVAARQGDLYRLDGEFAPMLEGAIADLFVLQIVVDGAPAVAITERAAGLESKALPVADRTRGVARIACRNVEIPASQVLTGAEAAKLGGLLGAEARLLVAADALGGTQAILDASVEYLKIREQFGKPIGTFQALKHRCADHKLSLEVSRRILGKAIASIADADRDKWSRMAKFTVCDAYAEVAADGVQLHGGIGFTWEHDAHVFLKRALLSTYLFGESALHQDRVAALLAPKEIAA